MVIEIKYSEDIVNHILRPVQNDDAHPIYITFTLMHRVGQVFRNFHI